jgi:hypothetical protein
LADLKQRIASAQARAAVSVSRELIALYWQIGALLTERTAAGWGEGVIERLAHDVQSAFPALKGFSTRNLWRMRAFYRAWSGASPGKELPQVVAEVGLEMAPQDLRRGRSWRRRSETTSRVLGMTSKKATSSAEDYVQQVVGPMSWAHHCEDAYGS